MATDPVLSPTRKLAISKLVNAPRELVWKVWTDPEHIKNWWGPNGFTNTIFQMDVKPGGIWDFIMHGPDGRNYKNKSIYKEVIENQKIVYDHVSAPKFQFTVTFTRKGKKTLIDIQMLFESAEERDNVVKVFKADTGLKENIYKLEGYLRKIGSEKEMTMTRILNAPGVMVFKAWTDSKQLEKWWGPRGFTNPVCAIDAVPGGTIHIHMKAPDGKEYSIDGEYHEVVEPERLVFTSAALDKNGRRLFEALNTVAFTAENDRTKLTLYTAVSNITDESRPYLDGMNNGWGQSLERLSELLANSSHNKETNMNKAPLVIERILNASAEKIWNAITNIAQMKQWYFPQLEKFEPEKGFETQFNVHHNGRDFLHIWKVKEVTPMKKISVEWKYGGYPGNSLVCFELFAQEGSKTKLVLTHEGIETFIPEKYPELARSNFMEGWSRFVDKGLKDFVESN